MEKSGNFKGEVNTLRLLLWSLSMYLKFNKVEDKLIVNLMGELDHHSAEEVRVKIDDRIDRDNIKKVILDFGGVTFMDSSGIGVVIGRHKKMKNRDGRLCIVEINKSVNKVFEISGMYKLINVYRNVDEAIINI